MSRLEPCLWGNLPKELLYLVFTCLPLAGIGRLRVLSKEWKRNVDCKDSEFNQVFDATGHLSMLALLSWEYFGRMWVFGNIYDVQADMWHGYKTDAALETAVGADGGLVCCVSKWKWRNKDPGFFIVMNPLTKQKTQLPPLLCMGAEKSDNLVTEVKMVKLTMDKKTKEYKVFVVGSIESNGQGFFAQVYDSHIKEWMVVEASEGYIIGWDQSVDYKCSFAFSHGLYVYKCADGTLKQFNGTNIALGLEVEPGCFTLIENHLFVLHKEASPSLGDLLKGNESMLQKNCISEFHFSKQTTSWVKLEVCNRIPFKCFRDLRYSLFSFRLWSCSGVLVVYGIGSKGASLYNLSTCEWHNLPTFRKHSNFEMMCEISWSAIA